MIKEFTLSLPLSDIEDIGKGLQYLQQVRIEQINSIIKNIENQVNAQLAKEKEKEEQKSVIVEGGASIIEE